MDARETKNSSEPRRHPRTFLSGGPVTVSSGFLIEEALGNDSLRGLGLALT